MQNKDQKYDSRFIRKTLRFSPDEYAKVETQLKTLGVNFTNFAKNAIIHHQITIPIQMDLIYELNRIGNNLNQIAKSINSKEKIPVLTQLIAIEKQLQKLQYK
ncbi:MAG: plasmid mobilization relaxosome protein MobC [Arcobacteraceae bacterium]|nr:plasmid mobilization relaxosome protein MobC [Arcobacteraceae bacterium]